MLVRIVALACLVASAACAAPRRHHPFASSASQLVPHAVAAPAEAANSKQQAHQAKLHYVEIGPSLKGDYKFGYDTGSGPTGQSFREETRLDDGTVKGAYGYVDANGKQRIVKYTAGKEGFVVDADQEAPGQGASAAQQPAAPQPAPRPQPVAAPQPHPHPHPQPQPQPSASADAFDEPIPINRVNQQQSQVNAEQQHAQQLRQHQLAQQQALAQQQQLAHQQQQQLQQQQLLQQQQQQQAQFAPQQPAHFAPQQQPQAQPQVHQVIDPQNGQFFSSSNDANLNQLLANQLRQLQQGNQFAQQFAQPPPAPAPVAAPAPQALPRAPQAPQHFAAQSAPAFPQHFAHQPQAASISQPINSPVEFNHQLRQTRQALPSGAGLQHQAAPTPAHQAPASPQAALLALHQQQQHDAQILANLRAQQLAQLQQQQRSQPQQQHQLQRVAPSQTVAEFQPQPQPQAQAPVQQPAQQASFAPVAPSTSHQQASQQSALASGPITSAAATAPAVQPEVFGPPVIDIRTLNYSIGQQTRVN